MSLIVAVYVPTGIALSGDSRTTGTRSNTVPDPQNPAASITVQTSIVLSDAATKVFLLFGRYGVGTFGDALVNNMPIAHYVEQFEAQKAAAGPPNTTQAVADALLAYFRSLQPVPNVGFVVAGYDGTDPWTLSVDVANNRTQRHNVQANTGALDYGILRGGDTDVANRLLSNPQNMPAFQVMNLQDAVDFSRHLIRSTIDQLRFEPRFPTVGGDIDTLVVKSTGAEFLVQKKLKCT